MLMLAGIDNPKLDSVASHPSSSSQPASPCRLSSRAPCADDYGWSGSTAGSGLVLRLLLLSLSVGRQSVSVSATVTAITGLQLRHHFRLRPKPEKTCSLHNVIKTSRLALMSLVCAK